MNMNSLLKFCPISVQNSTLLISLESGYREYLLFDGCLKTKEGIPVPSTLIEINSLNKHRINKENLIKVNSLYIDSNLENRVFYYQDDGFLYLFLVSDFENSHKNMRLLWNNLHLGELNNLERKTIFLWMSIIDLSQSKINLQFIETNDPLLKCNRFLEVD